MKAACFVLWLGGSWLAQMSLQPDPAIACTQCAQWNADREPFTVFGNTFYVGVGGLSSIAIASSDGLILIDGGLPQSAPLIDQHLRELGFHLQDIRLILTSHAHFDHVGGVAALQRASGATVVASAPNARALARGRSDSTDPQYAFHDRFPAVGHLQIVRDGETIRLGDVVVTAHLTPGHTPGSTTWTWRSCAGARCLNIVYADSLNPVSAPGFQFTGDHQRPSSVASFRRSISLVEHLPCDILLSVHPDFSKMDEKLQLRSRGASRDPFIDPGACRAYAAAARSQLDRRVMEEERTAPTVR